MLERSLEVGVTGETAEQFEAEEVSEDRGPEMVPAAQTVTSWILPALQSRRGLVEQGSEPNSHS
jgi:hypothetical protein